MNLLAYHITWGTYGTRLHGDPRRTVDRKHNQYGDPVLGFDQHRWDREKANLNYAPVVFTKPQMIQIESLLPEICDRGGWTHITGAAGPDHVHEILFSQNDPETIRRLFKRWLGQKLTTIHGEPGRPRPEIPSRPRPEKQTPKTPPTWWAECGSIRWIFKEDGNYFENAKRYINRQCATQ